MFSERAYVFSSTVVLLLTAVSVITTGLNADFTWRWLTGCFALVASLFSSGWILAEYSHPTVQNTISTKYNEAIPA